MDTIVGIDLGTTNSVVAIVEDGQPRVIEEDGQAILPSVVGLDEQGQLLIGESAWNQVVLAPERTIASIKRQMGEDIKIPLGDEKYSPQEISAMILRRLKERAEKSLGRPVSKAVITVPAFFNELQREATREAGELAGLEVVRIINEPTAAALTYEPNASQMERLLVYDLGGGTFDVSIVQIEQGVVEVLASHGDTRLGGDDFDKLLQDDVCDAFSQEHGVELRESLLAKSRTLRAVETAKKALSFEPYANLEEEFIAEKDGLPLHLNRELGRHNYEDLIDGLISKTLVCVDEALTDAKLQANQIDKVVLVGGASRTPLVHRLLQDRLGLPIHTEVDPDLCVALGAAVQGALISGANVDSVLVDITPHTLGVRTLSNQFGFRSDRVFSPIIERNTVLPASRSDVYTTAYDGQDAVLIAVYQGENECTDFNDMVGEFRLEGLAEVEQGNEILVRFDLDLSGILKVTAVERATGLDKRLVIDNAMYRFRSTNREAARARLDAAFQVGQPAEVIDPAAPAEGAASAMSEELRQALAEAEDLLGKGRKLFDSVPKEDADELRGKIDKLQAAVTERSLEGMNQSYSELEDLVFYLQDA